MYRVTTTMRCSNLMVHGTLHIMLKLFQAMGVSNGYRSTHLNKVYFDENGVIQDIVATMEGVEKVKI